MLIFMINMNNFSLKRALLKHTLCLYDSSGRFKVQSPWVWYSGTRHSQFFFIFSKENYELLFGYFYRMLMKHVKFYLLLYYLIFQHSFATVL